MRTSKPEEKHRQKHPEKPRHEGKGRHAREEDTRRNIGRADQKRCQSQPKADEGAALPCSACGAHAPRKHKERGTAQSCNKSCCSTGRIEPRKPMPPDTACYGRRRHDQRCRDGFPARRLPAIEHKLHRNAKPGILEEERQGYRSLEPCHREAVEGRSHGRERTEPHELGCLAERQSHELRPSESLDERQEHEEAASCPGLRCHDFLPAIACCIGQLVRCCHEPIACSPEKHLEGSKALPGAFLFCHETSLSGICAQKSAAQLK